MLKNKEFRKLTESTIFAIVIRLLAEQQDPSTQNKG